MADVEKTFDEIVNDNEAEQEQKAQVLETKETKWSKVKTTGKKIGKIFGGLALLGGAVFVGSKIGEVRGFDKAAAMLPGPKNDDDSDFVIDDEIETVDNFEEV